MLTPEQTEQIKEQILKQIEHFPEDKREQIKQQILSMSNPEFEEFLKQNNLMPNPDNTSQQQQCIFCLITAGKIKSCKIEEDNENLAVLEVNPLSKGHCLILPKKHCSSDDIPKSSFELAKKISKKIKQKFKPKEVKISATEIMSHGLIEVLPLYGNEKERKKADEKELEKLKNELTDSKPKQQPQKIEKPKPKIPEKPFKLKPRIP